MTKKDSFWKTLPGVLSASAAFIGAVAGAFALWYQIHPRPSPLIPQIVHFEANPTKIAKGETAQLCWNVLNVTDTEVMIDNDIGVQYRKDCVSVQPTVTTNYLMTATNEVGTKRRSATVEVVASPTTNP
jgi:hypothetical protein